MRVGKGDQRRSGRSPHHPGLTRPKSCGSRRRQFSYALRSGQHPAHKLSNIHPRVDHGRTAAMSRETRINGRIGGDDVDVLRAAIDQEPSRVAIDLEEVDLVASRVVNLFDVSEANGIELRNRLLISANGSTRSGRRCRRTLRTTSTPDEGVFEWTRV